MAWNSRTNWGPSDNKPTYTDLNSWGLDLRTWGGNVDAAGYNLMNVGSLCTNSNVGIGTANPTNARLHVIGPDGTPANIRLESYTGSGQTGAAFQGFMGRGTTGSPSAIQLGDRMIALVSYGYRATGFSATSRATIGTYAAENWTDAANGTYICFSTTPVGSATIAERMRIDSAGNVGIGLSPTHQLQLSTDDAAKTTTTTWTTTSDKRLKKNIAPFADGLAVLRQVNPVKFKYTGEADTIPDDDAIGIVAQDHLDVIPYCIGTTLRKLKAADEKPVELYTFNPHALWFVLINAVKELDARLATMEAKRG